MHWLWLMWRLKDSLHMSFFPFIMWALAMGLSYWSRTIVFISRVFLFVFVFPDSFLMPVVMWVSVTHRMDS